MTIQGAVIVNSNTNPPPASTNNTDPNAPGSPGWATSPWNPANQNVSGNGPVGTPTLVNPLARGNGPTGGVSVGNPFGTNNPPPPPPTTTTTPYVPAAGTQANMGVQPTTQLNNPLTNPISRPGTLTNPLARGTVNVTRPGTTTPNPVTGQPPPVNTPTGTTAPPPITNINDPTRAGTRAVNFSASADQTTTNATTPNPNPAVPTDWQHTAGVLPHVYGTVGNVPNLIGTGVYQTDPSVNPGANLPDWLKNQFHFVQQNSGGDGGQQFGAWQFGDGNGLITDQNGNSVIQIGDPRKLMNVPVNGGEWIKDPTAVHYDAFLGYVTSPNNIGSSHASERGFYAFGGALLGGGLLALAGAGGAAAEGVGEGVGTGAFDSGIGGGNSFLLDGAGGGGGVGGAGTGAFDSGIGGGNDFLLNSGPGTLDPTINTSLLPNVTSPTLPNLSPLPNVSNALIPGVTDNPLINNQLTRGLGTSLIRGAIMPNNTPTYTNNNPNGNVNTNGNPSGSPTGNNNGSLFNADGTINLGNVISAGVQGYSNNQSIQQYQNLTNSLIDRGDPNAQYRPGQLSTVNQLVTDPASVINNDPAYKSYRDQELGNESRLLAARGFNISGNEEGDLLAKSKNLDETYIHQRTQDAISASSNMNPQGMIAAALRNLPMLFQALTNRNAANASNIQNLFRGMSLADIAKLPKAVQDLYHSVFNTDGTPIDFSGGSNDPGGLLTNNDPSPNDSPNPDDMTNGVWDGILGGNPGP